MAVLDIFQSNRLGGHPISHPLENSQHLASSYTPACHCCLCCLVLVHQYATASSMLLGILLATAAWYTAWCSAWVLLPGMPRMLGILLGHWCLVYEMEKQYNRHTPNIGFVSRPTKTNLTSTALDPSKCTKCTPSSLPLIDNQCVKTLE